MIRSSSRFLAAALLLCFAAGVGRCQAGQWQFVAPMLTPRIGLRAAAGPDGRIYAIGGNSSAATLASVEAYDPRTNTWTEVAPMSTPRDNFGCVTGPDGRIYAIGGGYWASAEAYDTSTNQWSPIAPLPISDIYADQVYAAAVGNDGKIYAFIDHDDGEFNETVLITAYDTKNDTWSTPVLSPLLYVPSIPAVASDASGRIYYAGSGPLFIYDALAPAWTAGSSLPTPRWRFQLSPAGDGRLYALGGTIGTDSTATVDAYDPVLDVWSPVSPLNVPRVYCAATMGPDGRVYALGGGLYHDGDPGSPYMVLDSVEVYQPGQVAAGLSVRGEYIHAVEGAAFAGVVARFTDSESTLKAADFSATIQWGDGHTSAGAVTANVGGGFDVTGSNTYSEEGSYVTKVSVVATGGGSGSSSGGADVADAPLTATGLTIVSGSKSFSGVVATFTDANPFAAASDFTAVIRWGDGTSSSAGTIRAVTGGGFSVSGAHNYRKSGAYYVIVTIQDVGGSTATTTSTLNVGTLKK